ncbi:MAG: hypothetical protein WAL97_05185 [Halobacteriota archaeon]
MQEVLSSDNKSFDNSQRVICSTQVISLCCSSEATIRSVDVRDYAKARHGGAELGVFVGFVRYAGVRALRELSGEEILLKIIREAKEGKTDAEIERNVGKLIEDVQNRPRSGIYFDHNDGWKVDPFYARLEREIAQSRERLNVMHHSSMLRRRE